MNKRIGDIAGTVLTIGLNLVDAKAKKRINSRRPQSRRCKLEIDVNLRCRLLLPDTDGRDNFPECIRRYRNRSVLLFEKYRSSLGTRSYFPKPCAIGIWLFPTVVMWKHW